MAGAGRHDRTALPYDNVRETVIRLSLFGPIPVANPMSMDVSTKSLHRASRNRGNIPRLAVSGPDEAVPRQPRLLRQLRALRRATWIVSLLLIAMPVQAVLLMLPGRQKIDFAAFFWRSIARFLGLRVRSLGTPAAGGGRPVIYVCNHSSWADIPAVGGRIKACFVSKDDVAGWPIVGTVARLGRTVFVSRNRTGTLRERDEMQEKLAAGDALILFPEGTSSDGSRVLPFRSSFFAAAYGEVKPIIQPVSVVYDRLANLPVSHANRAVFAWYGDMDLAPHVWQLAQWQGKRVTLLFHAPLDPLDFADRKALAQAAWQAVADGAAALRQNRATPPVPAAAAITLAEPAFA
jgi:1-acyl-sn-glycerol-3-phosphate acyltransferase